MARRLGGAGAWVDLPIVILGTDASDRTLRRVEKEWIGRLGSLNGRRRRTVNGRPAPARTGARRRQPMRLRHGDYPERHRAATEQHRVRMYEYGDGTTTTMTADFGEVLAAAEGRKGVQVQVRQGRDVSRINFVTRTFGTSVLLVTYADGLVLRSQAQELLWNPARARGIGLERVVSIRLERTTRSDPAPRQVVLRVGMPDATIEQVIRRISKRAHARLHTMLGGMTYGDVRRVWNQTRNIRSVEHRKICRGNLQRYARRVWGVPLKHKATLRVETLRDDVVKTAKTAARRVIAQVDGPEQLKNCLCEEIRPVKTRPKTVLQDLGNWRKACANLDGTVDATDLCV